VLLCNVVRADGEKVVPNGNTLLSDGDKVIICSKSFKGSGDIRIFKIVIEDDLDGKHISEFNAKDSQIILISRGGESIIPHGETILQKDDILYINKNIR